MNRQRGMTLIEIILTLILLSILGGIAVVKFSSSTSELTGAQQVDQFIADIRHVQTMAMNWGCNLRVSNIANGYQVTSVSAYAGKSCSSSGAIIKDPTTNKPYTVTFTAGAKFAAAFSLDIDSTGRPNSSGVISSSVKQINIQSGGKTWQVNVAPITGLATAVKL